MGTAYCAKQWLKSSDMLEGSGTLTRQGFVTTAQMMFYVFFMWVDSFKQ